MKQISLVQPQSHKRMRKREFLEPMELVVTWADLVALIEPYSKEAGRRGQQPFQAPREDSQQGVSRRAVTRHTKHRDHRG